MVREPRACDSPPVALRRAYAERAVPLGLLLLAVVSVPVLVLAPSGVPRLERLGREQAQVEDEIAKLRQEIRRLRAEARSIKRDPAAVERVARDELGLVRRTEMVFQFEP